MLPTQPTPSGSIHVESESEKGKKNNKLKLFLNWRLHHQDHVDKVKVISSNIHVNIAAENMCWTWETEADVEGETVIW